MLIQLGFPKRVPIDVNSLNTTVLVLQYSISQLISIPSIFESTINFRFVVRGSKKTGCCATSFGYVVGRRRGKCCFVPFRYNTIGRRNKDLVLVCYRLKLTISQHIFQRSVPLNVNKIEPGLYLQCACSSSLVVDWADGHVAHELLHIACPFCRKSLISKLLSCCRDSPFSSSASSLYPGCRLVISNAVFTSEGWLRYYTVAAVGPREALVSEKLAAASAVCVVFDTPSRWGGWSGGGRNHESRFVQLFTFNQCLQYAPESTHFQWYHQPKCFDNCFTGSGKGS